MRTLTSLIEDTAGDRSYAEHGGWITFVDGHDYEQVSWAEKDGTKTTFGVQGAVVAFAFVFVLILLWKGKAMRVWAGPLNFATA